MLEGLALVLAVAVDLYFLLGRSFIIHGVVAQWLYSVEEATKLAVEVWQTKRFIGGAFTSIILHLEFVESHPPQGSRFDPWSVPPIDCCG